MRERRFILGGRQSLLSRIQIALVAKAIQEQKPKIKFKFLCKALRADQDLKTPLFEKAPLKLEGKGLFSSEFCELLLDSTLDIVIHSHKDLALESHPETEIISVLERADQRDILLFKKEALGEAPKNIIVLTSSLRRIFLLQHFLKKALPKFLQSSPLSFESVRGNITTRIKKLSCSGAHALVLAKAALDRLLLKPSDLFLDPQLLDREHLEKEQKEISKILKECTFMILPLSWCPNAPAQASLAAEIRKTDKEAKELLLPLMDPINTYTSLEERKELGSWGGGCQQKIGIACLERDYGSIQYLCGEDQASKPFWKRNFQSKRTEGKANRKAPKDLKKIWPGPNESLEIKRSPLAVSLPAFAPKYAWVSRQEAWPDTWKLEKENIIWTAGVKSLFFLAERGLWVHGCADALGEEEIGIESILGEKVSFVKLSHQKKIADSRWDTLSTYKIELSAKIPDLRDRTHFFWKSASQFDWLTEAYPEILEAQHACGPGLSRNHIQKKVLGPLSVYPDHQFWLEEMMRLTKKT